jgi:hypothetical protein
MVASDRQPPRGIVANVRRRGARIFDRGEQRPQRMLRARRHFTR